MEGYYTDLQNLARKLQLTFIEFILQKFVFKKSQKYLRLVVYIAMPTATASKELLQRLFT